MWKIFEELKLAKKADTVTYTTMIDSLKKCGKLEAMMDIFNEMNAKGIEPNQRTFNAMIDGFAKVFRIFFGNFSFNYSPIRHAKWTI
jgi:pentatricopeptide repeat protein